MRRSARWGLFVLAVLLFAQPLLAFGRNKIAYDRFDWKVYHAPHFDVYYYDEEKSSLQRVVSHAEDAYDALQEKFDAPLKTRVPLVYYATHSAFEQTNIDLEFIPERVGAFTEPFRDRIVLPIDMPDEQLRQLIAHELTHVFEFEVLFHGRLARGLAATAPTWFMEGLASFLADDESPLDRMALRDAVVNDRIPSIRHAPDGYFAYRYGHAVFRYVAATYGWDALRDFLHEYRNALPGSVEKPLRRSFDLSPDEFDVRFRSWLRRQYLPAIAGRGEPSEYGERFALGEAGAAQALSAVPSPSGDLVAALASFGDKADLVLLSVPSRKLLRNLTPGFPGRYEYVIAQYLTTGPVMGRDVAFSADGDHLAVFARKERGRSLLLFSAIDGRLERTIPIEIEQPLNPVWSPDGRSIAFHGFEGTRADIFVLDLESGSIRNVTADGFFDAAPVFTPDGRALVYSSIRDGYAKLMRIELDDTAKRSVLTSGAWNDIDPAFAPDGRRLFFSSDRSVTSKTLEALQALPAVAADRRDAADLAAYNVYALNLESGAIEQFTNVVGGAFTPAVFVGTGDRERLLFSSFYRGEWGIYTTTTDHSLGVAESAANSPVPAPAAAPSLREIDPAQIDSYRRSRLFVDHAAVDAGVNSDQTFVTHSSVAMGDMLGNRRLLVSLDSVSTYSNFDLLYLDLQHRMSRGARAFDERTFYVVSDPAGRRRRTYRQSGLLGLASYPFDRSHRVDFGAGWLLRHTGELRRERAGSENSGPLGSVTFTGDDAVLRDFGPLAGRRYELTANVSTLSRDVVADLRQYIPITRRSVVAARLFAATSSGASPDLYAFGGLNTLRGYDFRSLAGNRAFFANVEYRFPLVDSLATPLFSLHDIRGQFFVDAGGAYFDGDSFVARRDGRLRDVKAAVGYGVSMSLFGLELHWDFARRTDLRTLDPDTRASFWIGETF